MGILIGTIVVQDPDLLRAQDALIQKLSSDLKALDAQNERSRAEVARLEQSRLELEAFADEVVPLLVANRLFGRHIAVVGPQHPALQGLVERVKETLAASGASVRVVLLRKSMPEVRSVLESAGLTSDSVWPPGEGNAVDLAARTLVDSAVIGYDALLTTALLEAQCLSIEGTFETTAADSVVAVTDSVDPASANMQALQLLLDDLALQGVLSVVAAESGGPSRVPERAGGFDVISGLDTAPGRYSLVMALAGEKRRAATD